MEDQIKSEIKSYILQAGKISEITYGLMRNLNEHEVLLQLDKFAKYYANKDGFSLKAGSQHSRSALINLFKRWLMTSDSFNQGKLPNNYHTEKSKVSVLPGKLATFYHNYKVFAERNKGLEILTPAQYFTLFKREAFPSMKKYVSLNMLREAIVNAHEQGVYDPSYRNKFVSAYAAIVYELKREVRYE